MNILILGRYCLIHLNPISTMKTAVLTLATAALGLFGLVPEAKAGPGFPFPPGFGRIPVPVPVPSVRPIAPRTGIFVNPGHSYSRGYSSNSYRGGYSNNSYHYQSRQHYSAPRVIQTCVIGRHRQCVTAIDSCGRPYTVHLTVVTYRDQYCNGTFRTYTRTYR